MSNTIVVCVDDSSGIDNALLRAIDRAKDENAALLLYDVTAPTAFTSPRPNIWAGEGEAEQYDHPLDPVELEKLGRHNLALKVEEARRRGVQAHAWLPDHAGGQALADYTQQIGARLILLPDSLPRQAPELVDSIPENAPPIEYVG